MKTLTAVTTAGVAALALSVALVGCGSKTETKTSTSASTSSSTSTTTSSASPTSTTQAAGPNKTIADYIKENQIVQTPVHRGDPGSPTINLPFPPGWSDAGQATPAFAYGAILFDTPEVPTDPPQIIAAVVKLTGNVDPAMILQYAPGELKNLPDYAPMGDATKSTLGGFDAVQLGGNYTRDGKKRIIAQKTVVIPGQDGLYVLQMNADALDGQEGPLMDATSVIDEQTTITP
jgi:hypothetical protein